MYGNRRTKGRLNPLESENMALITAENAPILQEIFNEVSKERPSVGRTVRIMRGRYAGKIGIVRRHALSSFGNAYRHAEGLQAHMMDARGRRGWYVQVETTDEERFNVSADLTMVCCE